MLNAFRDPPDEIVVDAVLDQQAAGRGTSLAVEAIDHEYGGIQRALQIRVVENHNGILAAEFEMQTLQGSRPLSHDQAAGARFTDKRHGLDGLVFGQGDAGPLADAVDSAENTRGQAGFVARLGQQRGRQGAPFSGLVHNRTTRRQRRRDLPGRQHEGRVPGRDGAHRPDGLAHRIVHVLRRRKGQTVPRPRRTVREKPEVLRTPFGGRSHESDRLAGIHGFNHRDLFGLRLDGIGDVMEQRAAFATGHRPPVGERPGCGLGRAVDIVGVSRSHRAEIAVVHGGMVVESLTR